MNTLALHQSDHGVAQVEMLKPTFDGTMIGELAESFEMLAEDPDVQVIVLSGQGDVFSIGADLPRVRRRREASVEWCVADARAFARTLWLIESCAKPTIARVHGVAAGGALGLVCACDFAVASNESSFSVTDTSDDHMPSVIRPYLIKAMGPVQTEQLAQNRMRIDAKQAVSIGLVHAIVPTCDLNATINVLGSIFRDGFHAPRRLRSVVSKGPHQQGRRQR